MAKERIMSEEEKAKRAATQRAKFIPIRKAREVLMSFIAEGLRTSGNRFSHEEFKLLVSEAAKLQVSLRLGPHGNVEVKNKDKEVVGIKWSHISWSKLGLDEQADIVRALKAGKVITFNSDPNDEDAVEVTEAEAA